jgi:hypothetical protein
VEPPVAVGDVEADGGVAVGDRRPVDRHARGAQPPGVGRGGALGQPALALELVDERGQRPLERGEPAHPHRAGAGVEVGGQAGAGQHHDREQRDDQQRGALRHGGSRQVLACRGR